MHRVKRFNSASDFTKFLNYKFNDSLIVEYGTGYVSGGSGVFTAVTQTNWADWSNIDSGGNDITAVHSSAVMLVSGDINGKAYTAITSETANGLTLSGHPNVGSSSSPVNYFIYSSGGLWGATIVSISEDHNNNIVLVYKDASFPVYF